MNQAARWKEFLIWWDKTFPAGKKLDMTSYEVVNMIEDKIFELRKG